MCPDKLLYSLWGKRDAPVAAAAATVRYRLGYVLVNVFAVALIASIPGTFLWDPEAGEAADGKAFFGFLGAVALSILAYLAVQV